MNRPADPKPAPITHPATYFHFATQILREQGAAMMAEHPLVRNRSEASAVRNGEAPFQTEDEQREEGGQP